jgi:N-acetylglutamate synthase-like GNAT family acetyltransferase
MIAIEPGTEDDLPAIRSLLERSGLPTEGITRDLRMVVARDEGQVVGVAGLEVHAEGTLLRSVAVDASCQRHGIGQALTEAVLGIADTAAVFLLTTTAEDYFRGFGFERIERRDVPASVRTSVEFVSACPASAVVMRRLPSR